MFLIEWAVNKKSDFQNQGPRILLNQSTCNQYITRDCERQKNKCTCHMARRRNFLKKNVSQEIFIRIGFKISGILYQEFETCIYSRIFFWYEERANLQNF